MYDGGSFEGPLLRDVRQLPRSLHRPRSLQRQTAVCDRSVQYWTARCPADREAGSTSLSVTEDMQTEESISVEGRGRLVGIGLEVDPEEEAGTSPSQVLTDVGDTREDM